ncbi:MAG: hypothetical protein FWE29_04275 [Defluviitaleaceae bacterium]|nr:hypothetical protein [Defluviitaleaceae bacterium]
MKDVLYLLVPTIFTVISGYISFFLLLYTDEIILYVLAYALTLIYVVLYIKYKFSKMFMLPISFIIPAVLLFVFETLFNSSDFFQYMTTMLYSFFYALPFTVLTTIIAIVLKINRERGAKLNG